MEKSKPKFSELQRRIIDALRRHPEGLDIHELGRIVTPGGFQQELNRRVRELYPFFEIQRVRKAKRTVYILRKAKSTGHGADAVGQDQRARILHRDKGRCQMCGRTVQEDAVKLHIDHKIPRDWGGSSTDGNLQALCTECNQGKKNYFATFHAAEMEAVLAHTSVHRRIAELLRLRKGEWVDSELIEFVAGFHGAQRDWPKRLRELRYFGLDIDARRTTRGRILISQYRLNNWLELPGDPTKAARDFEAQRAARNRQRKRSGHGGQTDEGTP